MLRILKILKVKNVKNIKTNCASAWIEGLKLWLKNGYTWTVPNFKQQYIPQKRPGTGKGAITEGLKFSSWGLYFYALKFCIVFCFLIDFAFLALTALSSKWFYIYCI